MIFTELSSSRSQTLRYYVDSFGDKQALASNVNASRIVIGRDSQTWTTPDASCETHTCFAGCQWVSLGARVVAFV